MQQDELMKKFLEWQQVTRRCQRNWDKSKDIPKDIVEFLTTVAMMGPAKQNDRHFGLAVVTNKEILAEIQDDYTWGIHANQQGDTAMRNSQMHGPLAFVYGEIDRPDWYNDWEPSDKGEYTKQSFHDVERLEYEWQMSHLKDILGSIHLSAGQVGIAAAMFGYKVGYGCNFRYNNYENSDWRKVLRISEDEGRNFNPRLMLCIGHGNENIPWHVSEDLEMLVSHHDDDPTQSGNLRVTSNNKKPVIGNTIQPDSKRSHNGWGWWKNEKNEIIGMSHAHRSWDKKKQKPKPSSQILWERH